MTDYGVWTCGDDRLVLHRFDDGRGVTVLPKDKEHDTKTKQYQHIASQSDGHKNTGPAQAMIKSRHEEHADEGEVGDYLDDLLAALFLRCRPCGQPTPQELRILLDRKSTRL